MSRIYKQLNCLEGTIERISLLFDLYERISVSVSGGKDSSVLFHLAWKEAAKRNRILDVMFIDQEAEYRNTIDIIRHIAAHPNVKMHWYQIPFCMTNSVSYEQDYLNCWDGGQFRQREPDSIHDIGRPTNLTWEKILPTIENTHTTPTAQLIGLRSNESLNRYRAVTKYPAIDNLYWSSKTGNSNLINFYPIYSWGFDDIWRYIFDEGIRYNKIYDMQFNKGYQKEDMRISCLIHEKSYHCLSDLPEFEPDTFEWLCRRVKGIDTAMRYASEKQMYSNEKLPSHYKSWYDFREFLLKNHPNERQRQRFIDRFAGQPENDDVYKQQVGQLLINDWENLTDIRTDQDEKRKITKQKYIDVL